MKDGIDGVTLINLRELLSIFLIELLETACIFIWFTMPAYTSDSCKRFIEIWFLHESTKYLWHHETDIRIMPGETVILSKNVENNTS